MKILIVCSSNVCRSPYAEFQLKRIVENNDILKSNIEWIDSSAVFNRSKEIFPKTKTCLLNDGFTEDEIAKFKPSYIKDNIKPFEEADIIIGMTKSHKFFLPKQFKHKYKSLNEVAYGKYKAIPDPFLTHSMDKYSEYMLVIKKAIIQYAKNLENDFTSK